MEPPRRIHPAIWMILFLPFGATSGFVSITIGYLAKQQGLGDAAIAGLVALNLLPHTFKFFWAPVCWRAWYPRWAAWPAAGSRTRWTASWHMPSPGLPGCRCNCNGARAA